MIPWINHLEWGSVPDWFSAIGTVGAIAISLSAPYVMRGKVKVNIENILSKSTGQFVGIKVSGINYKERPINVFKIGIDLRKISHKKQILLLSNEIDFDGCILHQMEKVGSGINAIELYHYLNLIIDDRMQRSKVRKIIEKSCGNSFVGRFILKSRLFNYKTVKVRGYIQDMTGRSFLGKSFPINMDGLKAAISRENNEMTKQKFDESIFDTTKISDERYLNTK
ncbi:hypothetical protein [Periweissella ghanensis]|uniref:Uncharacterized protein n=1 Tax=Periweissella ghanensis TaxID=467997 RepID=A0ABN8BR22_9LACO|nr:hypothetical protein [Periweissella ghanensis]MCM0600350.1 hypothetical protein [Periweissella ghanensis]CAH0419266.1 hypothetical protein WGH24286_01713 [Periweissella ghanensis]